MSSSALPSHPDQIIITDLALQLPNGLGPSAFALDPPPPCPLSLTLTIDLAPHVIPQSTDSDSMASLDEGVNYSAVSKAVYARLSAGGDGAGQAGQGGWKGPQKIAEVIAEVVHLNGGRGVQGVHLKMELERAVLQARAVEYSTYVPIQAVPAPEATGSTTATMTAGANPSAHPTPVGLGVNRLWHCAIRDLRVHTIVGLHPYEKQKRQGLTLDVQVGGLQLVGTEGMWDHVGFTDHVYDFLEASSYGTLEALAESLAAHLWESSPQLSSATKIQLAIRKPSALPFAVPSVRITRPRPSTLRSGPMPSPQPPKSSPIMGTAASPSSLVRADGTSRIFIALGGNIGDRIGNITRAVRMLEEAGVEVIDESRLYESEPMYVEDQARFTNGAVEVRTSLSPIELLSILKRIEVDVGRTKTFRNGPRVVDLDLLLYGAERIHIGQVGQDGWLEVPHPRIAEREFVLRPLLDIDPALEHPSVGPISGLLQALLDAGTSSLAPIIPFPAPAASLRLDGTHVMQIFNATPDSFSDGSAQSLVVEHALARIRAMWDVPYPPAILDIGGMSTAPHAPIIDEAEETARVVPLIRALRALPDRTLASVPISIDTFRPGVARAAVLAGASMINDVYTAREPGMAQTVAELGVPLVLMHSRGDSRSMLEPGAQDYTAQGGVVGGVRGELGEAVRMLRSKGVRRWNIVLDPGLGFAKNHNDSLALLRRFQELRTSMGPDTMLRGYPWLIGGSRKRFVGRAIGRPEPAERGFGDAAVAAWAAKEGAELVRVHEGRGMGEVLRMWAALEGRGGEVDGGGEGSRGQRG